MNKNQFQIPLLLFVSLTLTACAPGPSHPPKPVPAGYSYTGSYINIRAPNSHGWHRLGSTPAVMAFARNGTEPSESYAASVAVSFLEETADSDEFVELMKKKTEEGTDPSRFETIELDFEYSEERGYPCVIVNFVTQDKKARTSLIRREVLLLQGKSLYCRHPERQETGFSIHYSYRGKTVYSNLNDEANDFINGVQVPVQGDN